MPDQEPIVWPDDPIEADTAAAEAEPAKATEPSWPTTFEDALKQSQAASEDPVVAPLAEPAAPAPTNEYPTQPSMPAITAAKTEPPAPAETAKTVPPEPAATEEVQPVLGTADELPTSTFKTPIPAPAEVSAANGAEGSVMPEATSEPAAEPEPAVPAEPALEAAPERIAEPEAEAEPVKAEQPEPEPEPVEAPEAEPEPAPAKEPEPAPEPVKAAEPETVKPAEAAPEPAPKEEEWVPLPSNPPVPAWAPKLGAATAAAEQNVDWGASNPLPAWAPIGGGRSTSNMPAATRISSTPTTPTTPAAPAASQPPKPAAPATAASQPPAAARASQPPAADASKAKTSSWEIVQPKDEHPKQAYTGPTAEDKSYAEWFAWAKRSGAPAGACHAAAQGAFRALSAGHDMNTAVQWATLAMASPPGLVSASRQLYCSWYSLGNIDLRLPSPQAHAFATGAIAALEGGADAPTAHQAGLAAAGITG